MFKNISNMFLISKMLIQFPKIFQKNFHKISKKYVKNMFTNISKKFP